MIQEYGYSRGLHGVTTPFADLCPLYAVDPSYNPVYDSSCLYNNATFRSNTMSEDYFEEDNSAEMTVHNFLHDLEEFLDSKLDPDSRGNVFLTKNGNGVSINLLIGAPFADSDEEVNQVNVIIAPTDREFLGSTGVSMDDRDFDDQDDPNDPHSAFEEAMSIL